MAVKTGSTTHKGNIDENNHIWECNLCGIQKTEKEVENLCSILLQKCEELINRIPDQNSIPNFEAFIKKYSGTLLHPNHMFLTNLKYSLSGFYGRLEGYQMQEMDEASLSRKKHICEEVLDVLNKVDSKLSPRKGLLLSRSSLRLHSSS